MVKPDLVVLTGDIVSGYAWKRQKKPKDFYKNLWQEFSNIFKQEKTYYAYTFGNHDRQGDYHSQEIMQLEHEEKYSLFKGMLHDGKIGLSNYYLKIHSSIEKEGEDKISALVWLFDTKDSGCEIVHRSEGCIDETQKNWYKKCSNDIKQQYHQKIDGLAFFHIPIPEFMYLWNYYPVTGDKGEDVYCPTFNTRFFQLTKSIGNIKGIFCGHDHSSDYSGFYKGVELVYGRKTGYGSYGPYNKYNGGTVIKLKEIIREDGTRSFNYNHYIIEQTGNIVKPTKPVWKGLHWFQLGCKTNARI